MKTETKNKIKTALIMFAIDVVSTILILYLLGVDTSTIFTKQSLAIIGLVNIIATFILSKFRLIEDGK